jgi:hypothetical protein
MIFFACLKNLAKLQRPTSNIGNILKTIKPVENNRLATLASNYGEKPNKDLMPCRVSL